MNRFYLPYANWRPQLDDRHLFSGQNFHICFLSGSRGLTLHCPLRSAIGKGGATKSDEFSEKFKTSKKNLMRQLQMFQKVEYGGGPIFKVVLEC